VLSTKQRRAAVVVEIDWNARFALDGGTLLKAIGYENGDRMSRRKDKQKGVSEERPTRDGSGAKKTDGPSRWSEMVVGNDEKMISSAQRSGSTQWNANEACK
jgi:hypothetical protein